MIKKRIKSNKISTGLLLLWLVLGTCMFGLQSCDQNRVFEDNQTIENRQWFYKDTLVFNAQLAEAAIPYNIFVNVRHSNDFPYANLWLKIKTVFPDGVTRVDPLNLPMANDEGKWYGSGLGDIISNQVLISSKTPFEQAGAYRFELWQDMRYNPVEEVLDVGFRIEKSE